MIDETTREISQGLEKPDWDPSFLNPIETPQPIGFAATVTISGVKHVLEASSEPELRQKESELYCRLFSQPAAGSEQTRDSHGRFTPAEQDRADEAAEQDAALRMRILRGEDGVDNLVEDFMQSRAIDPEALREVSAQTYQKKWTSATQEFLASSDWPGGETNKQKLGELVFAIGATDKPSAETLRAAYQHMKKNNLLVENGEMARTQRIANARTSEELRDAVGYRGDTALWGR